MDPPPRGAGSMTKEGLRIDGPISYAIEVMAFVHRPHHSHHHRSTNGPAGACA
jgi:hypothetical protein